MILIDIFEEHLDEADFLFQQRENALRDRVYALYDLAELEERLFAHLDGLALAKEEGWKLLEPKLSGGEVGEGFAAAFVALESGEKARVGAVREVFAAAEGAVLDGVRHALRHTNSPEVEGIVRPLLNDSRGPLCAAALDILSFRRLPIEITTLQSLLLSKDPVSQKAALMTVGRLGMARFREMTERVFESEDQDVRLEAIRSGILLGSGRALEESRKALVKQGDEAGKAAIFVALSGKAADVPLLLDALNAPGLERTAIVSLGISGNVAAMESLIRCAADPSLSRLAGEAISVMTGADLKKENLLGAPPNKPEPDTGAKTDSPDEDDDFESDPDEDLPFPDPEKLAAWWRANASRFDGKTRYRKGQPHGKGVLLDILRNGNLPERHHAAFELALLIPSQSLLETHAFAVRQQKEMAAMNLLQKGSGEAHA